MPGNVVVTFGLEVSGGLGVVTQEATSTSSNWASLLDIASSTAVASSFSFYKGSI